MLTRRAFLSLIPAAAALLCAAWPHRALAAITAGQPPLQELGRIIREKSLFATNDMDLSPLHEAWQAKGMIGLRSFLRGFDRYASFTTADELAQLRSLMTARPAGVGMDIFEDRQKRMRCVPYPGSPADKSGIRYADVLKGVDGQSVRGIALPEVAQRIRGADGSVVLLSVHSEGEAMRSIAAERSKTEYPTVLRTRISPAVIRIFRFSRRTPSELSDCLKNLVNDEGCVIDLRGNTGGHMDAGVECARLFLKKGTLILRLQDRKRTRKSFALKNGEWKDLPLSLVQDQFTASAAELFISSLTSAGRARSHGVQSAGKACVQNLFTLSDGSILKLTTEKMLYPGSDGDWEGTGLPPSQEASLSQ